MSAGFRDAEHNTREGFYRYVFDPATRACAWLQDAGFEEFRPDLDHPSAAGSCEWNRGPDQPSNPPAIVRGHECSPRYRTDANAKARQAIRTQFPQEESESVLFKLFIR